MSMGKTMVAAIACCLLVGACEYIVTPQEFGTPTPAAGRPWSAFVTKVGDSNGALHVEITIRNDSGVWSALKTDATGSARVTTKDGKTSDCGTVFVGTGPANAFPGGFSTSLAPGLQMRGYTGGTMAKQVVQPLYVECTGVAAANATTLRINYSHMDGPYNYYVPNRPVGDTFELDLSKVVTDARYPGTPDPKLTVDKPNGEIAAINQNTLVLTDVKRTDDGFEFSWQNTNPSDYPVYVHVGTPPVIGSDGVIYGFYQSPHLAIVPVTAAKSTQIWTTKVSVPKDVTGCFILLSVETKQEKNFDSHLVDIIDK